MKFDWRTLWRLLSVLLLVLVLQSGTAEAQELHPVIVLSPGHGWKRGDIIDPGATNGDLIEKDINLNVAEHAQDFLSRCPVTVPLTRDGDDPDHTLEDVDEIVNGYDPTFGISIHTNSASGNPSGTEGWYTVGGYDDTNSQQLAALLASNISTWLQIRDRGTFPETQSRHGGLYIHHWDAPAALIEIAFLQGDAEILRGEKIEFGRAISRAALDYIDIAPTCADLALPEGFFIATYFPGDQGTNSVRLKNDGLVIWEATDYNLINQGNPYGADDMYPLPQSTPVNQIATWVIPATAPNRPGIYRQVWQLESDTGTAGNSVTAYMIVVPEEARQLREDIDRRIEELREQGEEAIERFIAQLEEEALNWIAEELPNIICPQQFLIVGFMSGTIIILRTKRRRLLKDF